MAKSNLCNYIFVFAILIFFGINHRTAAYEQCLLLLPTKGYVLLEGNIRVSNRDVEDGPWFVDHAKFINYHCYQGYKLEGYSRIHCVDGQLEHPAPECTQIACNDPPKIENAHYENRHLLKLYKEGTLLEPICNKGYRKSNKAEKRIICTKSGPTLVWSGQPICEEIKCGPPKTPENGFIYEFLTPFEREEQSFPFGFTLNYGCSEGYQIVGEHFSRCEEGGWFPSNTAERCKKIKCPVLNHLENGYYIYFENQGHIEGVVKYGCLPAFNLIGLKTRVCLENGQWLGDIPKCVGKTECPDPGTPLRGLKYGNDYRKGALVKFECKNKYTLSGSKFRKCLENGTWSGTEVSCEKRNLPEAVNTPSFGRILDTSYRKGNLVLYFIFDSSSSVDPKTFNLSVNFVKALVKKVKVTADGVRVGAAAFAKRIDRNRAFLPIEYSTTAEVVEALERLKSINFTGGGTNIRGALEYFQEEIYPITRYILKNSKIHIFLITDGKYNNGGDPRNLATVMKKIGISFSCVGLSGNKGTNTKFFQEIVSESGNVYYLNDNENMGWLVDKVLTSKTDYSKCGIVDKSEEGNSGFNDYGRILGRKITETYWPWMATLRGQHLYSNKMQPICGGTLIDRKWILTAAHCMYQEGFRKTKRGNRDIEVVLGYTKNNINTYTQKISSWKIFMPQLEFNFITFDFDVALIMLEKEVDYTRRIRPVCLSPAEKDINDDSTLYAEKSDGWAIGYGRFPDKVVDHSEVSRDLREVPLDIGPTDKCINGLNTSQTRYTNRMFCAGGKKGVDTCDGDAGGPFMKLQYNEDGDGFWTQTGIVSFAAERECGLEGVYSYYTKVAAVREWIDHVIRTN